MALGPQGLTHHTKDALLQMSANSWETVLDKRIRMSAGGDVQIPAPRMPLSDEVLEIIRGWYIAAGWCDLRRSNAYGFALVLIESAINSEHT